MLKIICAMAAPARDQEYRNLTEYLVNSPRADFYRYVLENPQVRLLPSGDNSPEEFQVYKENKFNFLQEVFGLIEKDDIATLSYIVENFTFATNLGQGLLKEIIIKASVEMVENVGLPLTQKLYSWGDFGLLSELLQRDNQIVHLFLPHINLRSSGLHNAQNVRELEKLYDSRHFYLTGHKRENLNKHFQSEVDSFLQNKIGKVPFSEWQEEYHFLCTLPEVNPDNNPYYLQYTMLKMALKAWNAEDLIQMLISDLVTRDSNFDNNVKYLAKKHPEIRQVRDKLRFLDKMESALLIKSSGLKRNKL